MLRIEIPGRQVLELEHLVLDVNGTLAVDGVLLDGVEDAINELKKELDITLLTADTFGRGAELADRLGVRLKVLIPGDERKQKEACIRQLGEASCAAIGQGANDEWMLKRAALGICVLSKEGTAVATLRAADIVARDGVEALQLLCHPRRLVATLRS